MYPIMLSLKELPCLVVGGGAVATRRAIQLCDSGADVTVVARDPTPELVRRAERRELHLEQRGYRDGEADRRFRLVFAATNDRSVNHRVFADAESAGCFCNVADDPAHCSFHVPARIVRGDLQIVIGSNGTAPFLVRMLRHSLERLFGLEWGAWAEAAANFRRRVRREVPLPSARQHCYERFFAETLELLEQDTEPKPLRVRVPSAAELAAWAQSPSEPPVAVAAPSLESTTLAATGFVSLVGAGPGDPGLLTVRGRARLEAADAILYDRLALTALPCCDLKPSVELHWVGKESGHHPLPQAQINALMIRLAHAGKQVVRLKGGDPCIFGRGGEEMQALAAANVPFEVVPGVPAATAVPAAAGIALTQRESATTLTLVSAHRSVGVGDGIDATTAANAANAANAAWQLLTYDRRATVVVHMPVAGLAQTVAELLQAGIDPVTPVALIERGTTCAQRVLHTTVAQLPEVAGVHAVQPPTLLVIGAAATPSGVCAWRSYLPLSGQRLLVVGSGSPLARDLDRAGAEVVEVLLPLSAHARRIIAERQITGCVVQSRSQVELLDQERRDGVWQSEPVVYGLTDDAVAAARAAHWRDVRPVAPGDPTRVIERFATVVVRT